MATADLYDVIDIQIYLFIRFHQQLNGFVQIAVGDGLFDGFFYERCCYLRLAQQVLLSISWYSPSMRGRVSLSMTTS